MKSKSEIRAEYDRLMALVANPPSRMPQYRITAYVCRADALAWVLGLNDDA